MPSNIFPALLLLSNQRPRPIKRFLERSRTASLSSLFAPKSVLVCTQLLLHKRSEGALILRVYYLSHLEQVTSMVRSRVLVFSNLKVHLFFLIVLRFLK